MAKSRLTRYEETSGLYFVVVLTGKQGWRLYAYCIKTQRGTTLHVYCRMGFAERNQTVASERRLCEKIGLVGWVSNVGRKEFGINGML